MHFIYLRIPVTATQLLGDNGDRQVGLLKVWYTEEKMEEAGCGKDKYLPVYILTPSMLVSLESIVCVIAVQMERKTDESTARS